MSTVSDINRKVWLLLLERGGWWSARELEIELGLQASSMLPRMQKMKVAGSVAHRNPKGTRSAEFAVLPHCTVPQGITIGEVNQATSEAAPTRSLIGALQRFNQTPAGLQ